MFESERAFVKTAEAEINGLAAAALGPFDDAPAYTLGLRQACVTIWASAKTVRARGVAMAAKTCEQILDGSETMIACELPFAIKTLQRLIEQYAAGLREIDNAENAPQAQMALVTSPELALDATESAAMPVVCETLRAAQDDELAEAVQAHACGMAADILSDLMTLTRPDEQSALRQLIRVSGVNGGQSDTAGPAGNDNPLSADVSGAAPLTLPNVLVESLMGPVINSVLSYAHRIPKSVSLSYSVPELWMTPQRAAKFQTDMTHICALLTDMAAGHSAPRTLHISISALPSSHAADGAVFEITDNGPAIHGDDLAQALLAKAGAVTARVQLLPSTSGQGNRLVITRSEDALSAVPAHLADTPLSQDDGLVADLVESPLIDLVGATA